MYCENNCAEYTVRLQSKVVVFLYRICALQVIGYTELLAKLFWLRTFLYFFIIKNKNAMSV